MSLTEQIYQELMDGARTGLGCEKVLAKHSASKGPAYNALARAIRDLSTQLTALTEKREYDQKKLQAVEQRLELLRQEAKEAENTLSSLTDKKDAVENQLEDLENRVSEKTELLSELHEVKRLGFDGDNLKQLREALTEIGAKCGLRGKEAVSRFFNYLSDYGAVLQAEAELEALRRQIETKRLEVEEWQAKEEALRRKHDDLKDVIGAVHALRSRGIKIEQIIAWHRVLSRFETPQGFEQSLAQYGDMATLLKAKKEEIEACELRLTQVQGQVEALQKEKAKTEAAIEAVKLAGVKEVKAMAEAVDKQVKAVASKEIKEMQAMSQEVRSEFGKVLERVFELGERWKEIEQKLQKYERVKDTLDLVASEAEK